MSPSCKPLRSRQSVCFGHGDRGGEGGRRYAKKIIDWAIPKIARHVNFGGAVKYRATARVGARFEFCSQSNSFTCSYYSPVLSVQVYYYRKFQNQS